MSAIRGEEISPPQISHAVKALFSALGTPCDRRPWADSDMYGCHPVFGLAEHYRGHDNGNAGYTENPYRGDHMSIPCFTEDGDVFVLDISFHKGLTTVERVKYPTEATQIRRALCELLDATETR